MSLLQCSMVLVPNLIAQRSGKCLLLEVASDHWSVIGEKDTGVARRLFADERCDIGTTKPGRSQTLDLPGLPIAS